jgi:hypothetical protein
MLPTSALMLWACDRIRGVLLDLGPDQLCLVRVAAKGGHRGPGVEDRFHGRNIAYSHISVNGYKR